MGRFDDKNAIVTIADGDILPITDISDATDDKKIIMSQIKDFCNTGVQDLITSPTDNNIVTTDGSGQTKDSGITSTSVTIQGNTFNGASQLVQLDADSKLPAVDGSQLTNVIYKTITEIGTCSTAIATAEKEVTLTDFELVTGATIVVNFINGNTAATPTLNVNSTGVKTIITKDWTTVSANNPLYIETYTYCKFIYDGTYWVLDRDRLYCSGWFAVAPSSEYTLTDNCKTTNKKYYIEIADDINGTNPRPALELAYNGTALIGYVPMLNTANTLKFKTAANVGYSSTLTTLVTNAYYRVWATQLR